MDNLLFPVKLGPVAMVVLGAALGCGYRTISASNSQKQRLSVESQPPRVASLSATVQAVDGARKVLRQRQAHTWSDGYPRLELEVLRVDERPIGIVMGAAEQPRARGTQVAVTVRGWVIETAGGPKTRLTGDIRRSAVYGAQSAAVQDVLERERAIERAAHAAGRAVAERVLGLPVVSDDAP